MIFLMFLLAADVDPSAALSDIRTNFAARSKKDSLAAMEELARRSPTSEAGSEAAAWRGALAQEAGDLTGAEVWYQRAVSAPEGLQGRRLGARGLGDLA